MVDVAQPTLTPIEDLRLAAWNPRKISDENLENLCESIRADPDFLWHRPILAMADGTIYAGNMRYRAAKELGLGAVPAIREDVPAKVAQERAVRDNNLWGEWEDSRLAELLQSLESEGSQLSLLGFTADELDDLFVGAAPNIVAFEDFKGDFADADIDLAEREREYAEKQGIPMKTITLLYSYEDYDEVVRLSEHVMQSHDTAGWANIMISALRCCVDEEA